MVTVSTISNAQILLTKLLLTVEKRCIPILNDEVVNNITSTVNDMNPEKLLSSVKNIKALSQVEQVGLGVWTCVFK